MGLSGMGELVLTCTGDSRATAGRVCAWQGAKAPSTYSEMKMVAGGRQATEGRHALRERINVEMPLSEQVYAILYAWTGPVPGRARNS